MMKRMGGMGSKKIAKAKRKKGKKGKKGGRVTAPKGAGKLSLEKMAADSGLDLSDLPEI